MPGIFCIMYTNSEYTPATFPELNVFEMSEGPGKGHTEGFPSSHGCYSGRTCSRGRDDEITGTGSLNFLSKWDDSWVETLDSEILELQGDLVTTGQMPVSQRGIPCFGE